MRSRIFNLNWEDFDIHDREQRLQLAGALQYFCAMPHRFIPAKYAKIAEFVKAHDDIQRAYMKAQVQAFTLASDFPEKPIDVIERLQLATDYDNGYESIFDVRDFAGTKGSGFDVAVVGSGLTFKEVKPGEKAKVYQMSGEKERCYFAYYAGALGWHRQLFEDGDYWTAENNAIEFRNKAYSQRAAVFYALLEAAADLKGCCAVIPSDCSDCDADARSIANSINYAARVILENVKNRGYGLNPQTTQLIILTPLAMRERVRLAMDVRNQAFTDAGKIIGFNFLPVSTMMLTNPSRVFVILPKRGLMAGYKMDLTLFSDFDMLSYTDTVAGWMRYGGCIGDLDQIECIDFTAVSGSCPESPNLGTFIRSAPVPERDEDHE